MLIKKYKKWLRFNFVKLRHKNTKKNAIYQHVFLPCSKKNSEEQSSL